MPQSAEPPSATPAAKPRRRALIAVAAGGLILIVIGLAGILLFGTAESSSGFNWLTPAQWAGATHEGPLSALRHRVARWTGPLWRWYMGAKPQIHVLAEWATLPDIDNKSASAGLPPCLATNADGTRIWILPKSERQILSDRLAASSSVPLCNMSISTISGGRAVLQMGQPNRGPISFIVGLTVDILPKFNSGSIIAAFAATSTSTNQAMPGVVLTNLSVSCRVVLPNQGTLLAIRESQQDTNGDAFWLMLSIKATDAKGNLLQP